MLFVFNKIDKVADQEKLSLLIERYNPRILISANTQEGIEPLESFIFDWKNKQRN